MNILAFVGLAFASFVGSMAIVYYLAGLLKAIERIVAWGIPGAFEFIILLTVGVAGGAFWFLQQTEPLQPILLTSSIAAFAGLAWGILSINAST